MPRQFKEVIESEAQLRTILVFPELKAIKKELANRN